MKKVTIKDFLKRTKGKGPVCITGFVEDIDEILDIGGVDRPIIVYPETGTCPKEQSKHVGKSYSTDVIIITHSPYIVSDFDKDHVLVISEKGKPSYPDFQTFGASTIIIYMKIFKMSSSIGNKAKSELKKYSRGEFNNLEKVQKGIAEIHEKFGESLERTIILHKFYNMEKSLSRKKD